MLKQNLRKEGMLHTSCTLHVSKNLFFLISKNKNFTFQLALNYYTCQIIATDSYNYLKYRQCSQNSTQLTTKHRTVKGKINCIKSLNNSIF